MIMPVQQRCPKCGRTFMGSDAVGDPCMDCRIKDRRTQMSKEVESINGWVPPLVTSNHTFNPVKRIATQADIDKMEAELLAFQRFFSEVDGFIQSFDDLKKELQR